MKQSKKNIFTKVRNTTPDNISPVLPYDFNSAEYLKIHMDVADAGIEPAVHYVYQGIKEGRIYRYPEKEAKLEKL